MAATEKSNRSRARQVVGFVMTNFIGCLTLAFGILSAGPMMAKETEVAPDSHKRAWPPVWSQEVREVFFENAFDQLQGVQALPLFHRASKASAPAEKPPLDEKNTPPSNLVSGETLETEIKRLQLALAASHRQGWGGESRHAAQQQLAVLSVLFDSVSRYEGNIRWKAHAEVMSRQSAAASHALDRENAANDDVISQTIEQLTALVRGERPSSRNLVEAPPPIRRAIMRRMEISREDRIAAWLEDSDEFARHREDLRHEAELLAVLCQFIQRPEYEEASDEEYLYAARSGVTDALKLREAVFQADLMEIKQAAAKLEMSCTHCHDTFR